MDQKTKRGSRKPNHWEIYKSPLFHDGREEKPSLFNERRPLFHLPSCEIWANLPQPDEPFLCIFPSCSCWKGCPAVPRTWWHFTTPLGESFGRERMLEAQRQNFIVLSVPALLGARTPGLKFHKLDVRSQWKLPMSHHGSWQPAREVLPLKDQSSFLRDGSKYASLEKPCLFSSSKTSSTYCETSMVSSYWVHSLKWR